jgi:hypothetical protein
VTRKEHAEVLRNNRAAVGRTKSGPPVSLKVRGEQNAAHRRVIRARIAQVTRKPT